MAYPTEEPIYSTISVQARHRSSFLPSSTVLSRGLSGRTCSPDERTKGYLVRSVIGRFRCDARLIREAFEIDFRVVERRPTFPKDSRPPLLVEMLHNHRTSFLSFWTKISPRRKTASRGKCSHLRQEISRYPEVDFYGIRGSLRSFRIVATIGEKGAL